MSTIDLTTYLSKNKKNAEKLSQIQRKAIDSRKTNLNPEVLELLCEELDQYIKDQMEIIEDPEGMYGEIVHECPIRTSRLSEEAEQLVEKLRENFKDQCNEILRDCSKVEFTHHFHERENEIASFHLGEIEVSFPDELFSKYRIASFDDLSLSDQRRIRNNVQEAYVSDKNLGYISYEYCRFSLILDEDQLRQYIEDN